MTPREGVCYILFNCYKRETFVIICCFASCSCYFKGKEEGQEEKRKKKEKEVRKRGKKGESSKDGIIIRLSYKPGICLHS